MTMQAIGLCNEFMTTLRRRVNHSQYRGESGTLVDEGGWKVEKRPQTVCHSRRDIRWSLVHRRGCSGKTTARRIQHHHAFVPDGGGWGDTEFFASIDYTGAVLPDAVPLVGAPNVRSFNSVNSFGRRVFVFNTGPQFADALKPDESQIAHAFLICLLNRICG